MELVADDVDRVHLLIRHPDAALVGRRVHRAAYLQARRGRGGGDQADHGLERPGADPVASIINVTTVLQIRAS